MRNVRRWKKLCAAVLAAVCLAGTVGQNFTGSCSFVQAAETESETEAETVYSQEDLELLKEPGSGRGRRCGWPGCRFH